MNTSRSSYIKYSALTSFALALTLSSCAAPVQVEPTPTEATVNPTVTQTTPAPQPTVKATTPQLTTFTFSDGHISFDYPKNWTVETKQGPYIEEKRKANSFEAVISDENGKQVARIRSGGEGGATSGPVIRTVLDSKTLPSFHTQQGASSFVFIKDDIPSGEESMYFMGVMPAKQVIEGSTSSSGSFLLFDNGLASAEVVFDSPAFQTADDATEWMETEQYKLLKSVMTSLKYV